LRGGTAKLINQGRRRPGVAREKMQFIAKLYIQVEGGGQRDVKRRSFQSVSKEKRAEKKKRKNITQGKRNVHFFCRGSSPPPKIPRKRPIPVRHQKAHCPIKKGRKGVVRQKRGRGGNVIHAERGERGVVEKAAPSPAKVRNRKSEERKNMNGGGAG